MSEEIKQGAPELHAVTTVVPFTWDDVTRLRLLLGAFEPEDTVNTWLPELADRIEALLPPRDVVPKEPA